MARDVVAVLDELGIDRAHYLGYSMGGIIGWAIAQYCPDRFLSLSIGGGIIPEATESGLRMWWEQYSESYTRGMDTRLAYAEKMSGQWWSPEVRAWQQANDLKAVAASVSPMEDLGFMLMSPAERYPGATLPCLVRVGEEDEYYACRPYIDLIPTATFFSLPGLDHGDAQWRSDLVVPHVREFLAQVELSQA